MPITNKYFIIQFAKPKKHRAGQVNRDMRQIGDTYHNALDAQVALANYMDKHRAKAFLRIDRNARNNSIVYGDLNENGGVVRFRLRDNFHFSNSIPLSEFTKRLHKQLEGRDNADKR